MSSPRDEDERMASHQEMTQVEPPPASSHEDLPPASPVPAQPLPQAPVESQQTAEAPKSGNPEPAVLETGAPAREKPAPPAAAPAPAVPVEKAAGVAAPSHNAPANSIHRGELGEMQDEANVGVF